ncbi:MAG: response regulator transcription factor [Lachnospiraceae bacterium]|nr:response regulator transcription factor [Lachnospiraceae bacterium]
MRLLLAEDEKELSRALVAVLTKNNYTVDAVYNGEDALDYAKETDYDGIILDVMMPVMDGIEALKKMRKAGVSTPVIMLTAKAEVNDRIAGLDAGADDYLPKPFAMGELLARLRSITRRKGEVVSEKLEFGDIYLDISAAELGNGKESYRLTHKEFQVMELLLKNSGNLISTERMLDQVWGYDSDVEINVVWVAISSLRKKLTGMKSNVEIQAVRGIGYTLKQK